MTGFQQTGESLKDNQESKVREDSSKNEPFEIDQDFGPIRIDNYTASQTEIVEIVEEFNEKIIGTDVIQEKDGEVVQDQDIEKRFCTKCNGNFTGLVELAEHFFQTHLKKETHVECPICPNFFRTYDLMMIHVRSKHLSATKKCLECDKFVKLGQFRRHLKNVHGVGTHIMSKNVDESLIQKEKSEEIQDPDTTEQFCYKCNEKFIGWINLANHVYQKHKQKKDRFECPKCFQKFKSCFHMLTHVKTIHLKAKKKCLECNKFFNLGGYPTHMNQMHGKGKKA